MQISITEFSITPFVMTPTRSSHRRFHQIPDPNDIDPTH